MDKRITADERRSLYRYRFGTVEFDEAQFELRIAGLAVDIQRKPLEVLALLLSRTDEVLTKDYLLDKVWEGRPTVDNVLANAIAKLRSALGDENANRIVTQARVGYRLIGPVERVAVGRSLQSTIDLRAGGVVPRRENFNLISLIGASPNSEVWLARHRKTGEARVYKFTPHGDRLAALKREVTLYRVLHDSLGERSDFVKILDWNFEESPFYLESEYGGLNLADWASEDDHLQALSSDERVELFLQIAEAVAAAHSVGVLHKDLKPTNVFVAPKEGGWQIRVGDFGSGRLLDLDRLDQLGITRLGLTVTSIAGVESTSATPLYVAPEVISGYQPTAQSDVYTLGLILYQLLTGDLRKPMVSGWERNIPDEELRVDIAKATDGDLTQRLPSAAVLAERLRSRGQRKLERQQRAEVEKAAAELQQELNSTRAKRPWIIALVASLVVGLATTLLFFLRDHSARIEAQHQAAETQKAQSRLLTEAAAQRLKDGDVAGAQAIILEVLTNPQFTEGHTPNAISVFQEARAADAEIAMLAGPGVTVVSAAYSPDGTRIVTASFDKTARIWDAQSGKQLAVLAGHGDTVSSAAYSPDGTRIVTASADKTARIWDAQSGNQLAVLTGHSDPVASAAYSPDGTRIVTASIDKTARIWDARTGTPLAVLPGHAGIVHSAAYSPDGTRIVTSSFDKTARIWDARSGKQLVVLSGHDDFVDSAAYSPDGARILTSSNDKTARIWDARTGVQLAVLSGHGDIVYSAAFSPDGTRIVTASYDKTARIWDARTGTQLKVLSGHGDFVLSASYSPDGIHIVTASNDKTSRIWEGRNGMQLVVLSGHGDFLLSAAYSPDGTHVVTASNDKTARIWDAQSGKQLAVLSGHDATVLSAAYSPDGTRIVTASVDKNARIWDAQSGEQLAVLSGHSGPLYSAAYSPDGLRIVTASGDKTARIWDVESGKQLAVFSNQSGPLGSASFSPDGARVVAGSFDKTARIWDARSGKQIAVFSGHGGPVSSAGFSPDGTRIVTASYDNTARIWDAQSAKQLAMLSGHSGPVGSAAYSSDGTRIVTSSADKTARIWDARTGTQLAVLSGHGDLIDSAAYSPDGARIGTASYDKTARIWDARVQADIEAQIQWQVAAQADALSDVDRIRLGLPSDPRARVWLTPGSACDQAAGAFYDPERRAPGTSEIDINGEIASPACVAETAQPGHPLRLDYQLARALLAKHDLNGARRMLEYAASKGYRTAGVDLGNLLTDGSAGMLDPERAILLYEKSWRDGVPIAAFALGHLYEFGVPGQGVKVQTDPANAWAWYQKGADVGEPTALARIAAREENNGFAEQDRSKADAAFLAAFRSYTAAAERAHDEDWPDEAWRIWRYRRATLARLLAHEGMMSQVADAYRAVHNNERPVGANTWWEEIKKRVSW